MDADPVDDTAVGTADAAAQSSFAANLFAIPVLCLGLGLIAACVLLPQAEANRRLAVDRDQLRQDLAHADDQLAVDGRFLEAAATDPEVAERLAQRQMRQFRQGATALHLDGETRTVAAVASAADMLRVPTPPPVPRYRPSTDWVATLTRTTRRQLYGLGAGLFLVAVSLVLGGTDRRADPTPEPQ